ncbi:hypothetical protein HZR81_01635 [Pseudomonas sp. LM13]
MSLYRKSQGCVIAALLALSTGASSLAQAEVGFFSPQGVFEEFSDKVDFAMVNAYSIEQVESSLIEAQRTHIKLFIDLGPQFRHPAPIAEVGRIYIASDGTEKQKLFPARADNKVWADSSEGIVLDRIKPFLDLAKRYGDTIDTLFLIDEPYLNGVSKQAYERLTSAVRSELSVRGLDSVKIGVIFAGAMFNRDFAKQFEQQAARYVEAIDQEYSTIAGQSATPAQQEWIDIITTKRLTTYDLAGNMYTEGGVPDGVDVVSFDYYVSTLLLDSLHEHSLAWFASRFPKSSCERFTGKPVSEVRHELSFFKDGPVLEGRKWIKHDRDMLNAIYQCRMNGALALLRTELEKTEADEEIMLIGESSNNGLLEFDARAVPEQGQPAKLVELRVRDEVIRAKQLLAEEHDIDRLMFFTYQDEYDHTIKLQIGGASGMASVLEAIYKD